MTVTKSILVEKQNITLPEVPALFASANKSFILTPDGELRELSHAKTCLELKNKAAIVCHAPLTTKRLNLDQENICTFDVLELFAFVHPTIFCVPTPVGLCKALGMNVPKIYEDYPLSLLEISRALLKDLQINILNEKSDPIKIAGFMGKKGKGWSWTRFIYNALNQSYAPQEEITTHKAINVWKHLPEWTESSSNTPSTNNKICEAEAQTRLAELISCGDKHSVIRPQQVIYSNFIAKIFTTPEEKEPNLTQNQAHIVLAEAGTGTGKTLGYLAPASIWLEKNEASVWISTFTKNLQHQIDNELNRLYPNSIIKEAFVAIRKGRENYLCLLNLEEFLASSSLSINHRHAIAAGIMSRWVAATKDGDLSGIDFPGWLTSILGIANTLGLADRRGECLFSSCAHYNHCFVESSIRKSRRAKLVIANHAVVMTLSALTKQTDLLPTRYIFDEGHHIFEAADSTFSIHMTARESLELRRWLLGNEEGKKGRLRGLKKRMDGLINDDKSSKLLSEIIYSANSLCSSGWGKRIKDGTSSGPFENFIAAVHKQIYERSENTETIYSLETEIYPLSTGVQVTALKLKSALILLVKPMEELYKFLQKQQLENKEKLDDDTKKRTDSLASSLQSRGISTLKAWIAILETIEQEVQQEGFVDWMEIERIDGKSIDVGIYRHYIDPLKPFADTLLPQLQGIAITSATLKDSTNDESLNWEIAKERTGVHYLAPECNEISLPSPFDYNKNTKIIVINDVNKNNLTQVSNAYKALFHASNGGALGLFTSIQRLRNTYSNIANPLEEIGISLYAQHIDDIDTGTLVDIFRDDTHACLLGTDAVRDGIDIPGESLRLIVFDRVPWPRPNILHKTRRSIFGKQRYDDMLTRLKLKQAFGRLIRNENDRGIFILLDSALPSRLHGAFPRDVEIIKTDIKNAICLIKDFLHN